MDRARSPPSIRLLRMDARGCGLSDRGVDDHLVRGVRARPRGGGRRGRPRALRALRAFAGRRRSRSNTRHATRSASATSCCSARMRAAASSAAAAGAARRAEAQLKLVESGWGRDDASYRQFFASQFMPGATLEQLQLDERAAAHRPRRRRSRYASCASFHDIDVSHDARRACAARRWCCTRAATVRVPFEEGRSIATLIPGARFVPLESDNHILLEHEPAFAALLRRAARVPAGRRRRARRASPRSRRARPRSSSTSRAASTTRTSPRAWALSEKTVRNHITHIFDKIGVESRAQAIVLAREQGLGRRS